MEEKGASDLEINKISNDSFFDGRLKNVFLEDLKKETSKFEELQNILSKEGRIFSEIKKRLSDYSSGQTLISCDPINNHDFLIGLSRFVLNKKNVPLIVLTSTNYKSAGSFLEGAKINSDDVFLMDTVSKNISQVKEKDNLFFVDSLRNLTQLQIKLVKIFRAQKNVVIVFDSVNVLGLYHNEKIIFKFVYSLTKIMHKYKITGFFIVNKQDWVQKIGQFCDNIVEIEKIE